MSTSLPVSTSECNASESIAALPENAAATNFEAAMRRFPAIAAITACRVSLAIALDPRELAQGRGGRGRGRPLLHLVAGFDPCVEATLQGPHPHVAEADQPPRDHGRRGLVGTGAVED